MTEAALHDSGPQEDLSADSTPNLTSIEELLKTDPLLHDTEVSLIDTGTQSQAFLLELPTNHQVLRINREVANDYGFRKDAYAAEHFTSPGLPIPAIHTIGQTEQGLYYAISDAVPGHTPETLDKELLPQLIQLRDAMDAIPVTAGGYGFWDPDGEGPDHTWTQTLRKLESDLSSQFEQIHESPLFDAALVDRVSTALYPLIAACPQERKLVHGDPGSNILVKNGKITGLIDWEQSMYGDPLYDIAKLDLQYPQLRFARAMDEHYKAQNRPAPLFYTRIRCYKLLTAMSDLVYFTASNQPDNYDFTKEQIIACL